LFRKKALLKTALRAKPFCLRQTLQTFGSRGIGKLVLSNEALGKQRLMAQRLFFFGGVLQNFLYIKEII